MSSDLQAIAASLLVVWSLAGCQMIDTGIRDGKSPLKPIKLADDGVQLEIVHARFPQNQPDLNESLWKQIDETQLSAAQRQQLTRNGLRAGIVGGQLPSSLEQLLTGGGETKSSRDVIAATNLETEGPLTRHVLNLRPGGVNHIVASSPYTEMVLLRLDEEGAGTGYPYKDAQCMFVMKAYPQGDGHVRLKLTPQVEHGAPKQHFPVDAGLTGTIRPQPAKDKLVFEELAMDWTLARGQMLVLGCHTERPCSAGHYFFTDDSSGNRQQKLLIIRLSESKWDDLFARHTAAEEEEPAGDNK